MSAIKRFFEKKKLDTKFKQAGGGHHLNETKRPSSASTSSKPTVRQAQSSGANRAGEAALAR